MKKIQIFFTMLIISFFIFSYSYDSITKANDSVYQKITVNNNSFFLKSGSSFIWEDDFLDESKIDKLISYNYELDKNQGIVYMVDTYEAWYNTDFTRMKMTNTGVCVKLDFDPSFRRKIGHCLFRGEQRCRQIVQTQIPSLRLNICATPDVDMPNRLAVSANDTPYSLISFNAIALLSFGKGGRRLLWKQDNTLCNVSST